MPGTLHFIWDLGSSGFQIKWPLFKFWQVRGKDRPCWTPFKESGTERKMASQLVTYLEHFGPN